MIIVSKDRSSMVVVENTSIVYIGEDRRTIKAICGPNDRMYKLGLYGSESEALAALDYITRNLKSEKVCYMPDKDELKAKIINANNVTEARYHGRKNKGHGGS